MAGWLGRRSDHCHRRGSRSRLRSHEAHGVAWGNIFSHNHIAITSIHAGIKPGDSSE
jgi:hypothetical protein